MMSSSSLSSNLLPEDILIGILLMLPARYLLKLRLVCKYWFNLLSDPRFIKMHINFRAINKLPLIMRSKRRHTTSSDLVLCSLNYSLLLNKDDHGSSRGDPPQLQLQQVRMSFKCFYGSCNGLLCMKVEENNYYPKETSRPYFKDIMCLWNPCTKEFKELPDRPIIMSIPNLEKTCRVNPTYGFGYDSTTDDYKVIRNICFHDYNYSKNEVILETLVEVYTLRTDSWKTIGNSEYEFGDNAQGLFINGGIYWFARKSTYIINIIICFDIANEDYREISNPPFLPVKTDHWRKRGHVSSGLVKLTELKGFLCIINSIIEHKCLEVWAMGMDTEEWSKLFTIKEPLPDQIKWRGFKSFELLGSGSYKNINGDEIIVLVCSDEIPKTKSLLIYNPKNDKTTALPTLSKTQLQTCTESLMSLNSGTYVRLDI